jgi:hypothetical protein
MIGNSFKEFINPSYVQVCSIKNTGGIKMNKKITAIICSALMMGLAIMEPVLATSINGVGTINNLVSVSGNTPTYPIFVIGATAATSDVAAAVDTAVGLTSGLVTTQNVTVPGTTGTTITGGASMSTVSNPLTMWDNFASSKQVLTSTDLPTLLASGTYTDEGSVSSPYSQYLTFTNNANNGQVVYSTPNGGTAPQLGLKFAGGYQIYDYLLSFTKQITESITSNSLQNMISSTISMLGQTWTITNAQITGNQLDITMLAGQNSQLVTTATPVTYNVGSKSYTVTLVAVGTINGQEGCVLDISGSATDTLQLTSGQTKVLSDGTMVGVSGIFQTKQGGIDSATVFVGANKLELVDNDITDGNFNSGISINGQLVTDSQVRMIGTVSGGNVNLNSIELEWTPTLEQFITSGNSLKDEITNGAFSIFFGGITPALSDSANREIISVTPSGTTAGISFITSNGNSLNQNFALSSASGSGNIALKDASGWTIHVVEGETVNQNEYMVLGQNNLAGSAQNPFGHILRVLSLSTSSATTSQFQDVATGQTISVTGGDTTMYLDGQPYHVHVISTTQVQFTWGTGAGYGTVGNSIDVYPSIQSSKGAWVALTTPVTINGVSAGNTINLPTGSLTVQSGTHTTAVGQESYYTALAGSTLTLETSTPSVSTTPGVMIVEGLDESQIRNIVQLKLDSDATYNRVDIVPYPAFTGTVTTTSGISGSTQNDYMDKYGSFVTYDSNQPGTFSISYPVNQVQAIVGVGANPSLNTGTSTTVTTQSYHPVLADVVKLDTEITQADEQNNDLILVGGPCVNTLVTALYNAGKFQYNCSNWALQSGEARIQVIPNAFANGKTVVIIAGTNAADTDLAAQLVQRGLPGATNAQLAQSLINVEGTVSNPIYL